MTTMLFAMILPDWNSLDSVRRTHSDLECAALVFFALLVLFDVLAHLSDGNKNREKLFERIGLCCFAVAVLAEIAAYPYGQRNDALSAQVIVSLDAKAQDAADAAERAKKAADGAKTKADAVGVEADQTQTKIAGVDRRADVLAYFLSARRVQDESGLENDLRKEFRGEHIAFDSYVGDEEAYWLCSQLARIAQKASVDSKDECATKQLSKRLPITDLHISAPTIDEGQRLSMVLKKPKRVPGYFVGLNVAPEVTVTVGVKPSTPLFPMVKRAASKKSTKQ
jgi:hypothetical protein